MEPYPKAIDELLLKPGCLQYKDKDKGEKGLKIKIKRTILFSKFRFLITCFPSYPEFSR